MSTISSDVLQLPPTLQLQNYVDSSILLYLYFFGSNSKNGTVQAMALLSVYITNLKCTSNLYFLYSLASLPSLLSPDIDYLALYKVFYTRATKSVGRTCSA